MDKKSFHKVINDFLFGSKQLSGLGLLFQVALEDKIDNLKDNEYLFWYCDYVSEGNLYDFYKTFARPNKWGSISYPMCGLRNKSGIYITNDNGRFICKIKRGYGQKNETFIC